MLDLLLSPTSSSSRSIVLRSTEHPSVVRQWMQGVNQGQGQGCRNEGDSDKPGRCRRLPSGVELEWGDLGRGKPWYGWRGIRGRHGPAIIAIEKIQARRHQVLAAMEGRPGQLRKRATLALATYHCRLS